MAENNFYEWLGLPVERFENDPAKLVSTLEKYITDLKSSKDFKEQNKIAIYETEMRKAIQKPVLWMKIYLEYKKDVDEKIANALMMCADIKKSVSENYVISIAEKFKVTTKYVKNVGKTSGYNFLPTPKPAKYPTLDSLEPEKKIKDLLDSSQKLLVQLGFPTLAELIQSEDEKNVHINFSTVSNEEIQNILNIIKKKWRRVPSSSEKYQHKSNIDKICSGMNDFLKNYDISIYIQYINWKKVKEILDTLEKQLADFDVNTLNAQTYNRIIGDIFSVICDRESAQSILINYCLERNIGYEQTIVREQNIVGNTNNSKIENLLKRGTLCLEDRNWDKADDFFEQVLNENAEEYRAYIGKLCAELEVQSEEDLVTFEKDFTNRDNYKKACRFGGESVEQRLFEYNQQGIYNLAFRTLNAAKDRKTCDKAKKIFYDLKNFKDSAQKIKECDQKALQIEYDYAVKAMNQADSSSTFRNAANLFSKLGNFKDAAKKLEECKKLIEEYTQKEVYEKYNSALYLMEHAGTSHKMRTAKTMFEAISSFSDSAEKASECEKKAVLLAYLEAERLMKNAKTVNEVRQAADAFRAGILIHYSNAQKNVAKCNAYINAAKLVQEGNSEKGTTNDFEQALKILKNIHDFPAADVLKEQCIEKVAIRYSDVIPISVEIIALIIVVLFGWLLIFLLVIPPIVILLRCVEIGRLISFSEENVLTENTSKMVKVGIAKSFIGFTLGVLCIVGIVYFIKTEGL